MAKSGELYPIPEVKYNKTALGAHNILKKKAGKAFAGLDVSVYGDGVTC